MIAAGIGPGEVGRLGTVAVPVVGIRRSCGIGPG